MEQEKRKKLRGRIDLREDLGNLRLNERRKKEKMMARVKRTRTGDLCWESKR
jgi:hypothetical protein